MNIVFLNTLCGIMLCLLAACQTTGPSTTLPFWGVALDGNPLTSERLNKVEAETGHPFQMVVFFLQWPAKPDTDNFPTESLTSIQQKGAIPCLTWEPIYYENGRAITVAWQKIVNGEYDPYLIAFARQAKTFNLPLIIRLGHEMNLNLYHWGTPQEEYGLESPEIYKRIYRHVVEVFRKEGADKVQWAFVPNSESVPPPAKDGKNDWNRVANYYPGHAYVDILGMDGYNWGPTKTVAKDGWQSRWQSFAELFDPLYRELRTLAPEKPIIVFEMASTSIGGDKSKWLADALTTAKKWQLAGLVWFEVDKEQDWRLATGMDKEYQPLLRSNTSSEQQGFRYLRKQPQ